jgi:hypothetical protein
VPFSAGVEVVSEGLESVVILAPEILPVFDRVTLEGVHALHRLEVLIREEQGLREQRQLVDVERPGKQADLVRDREAARGAGVVALRDQPELEAGVGFEKAPHDTQVLGRQVRGVQESTAVRFADGRQVPDVLQDPHGHLRLAGEALAERGEQRSDRAQARTRADQQYEPVAYKLVHVSMVAPSERRTKGRPRWNARDHGRSAQRAPLEAALHRGAARDQGRPARLSLEGRRSPGRLETGGPRRPLLEVACSEPQNPPFHVIPDRPAARAQHRSRRAEPSRDAGG